MSDTANATRIQTTAQPAAQNVAILDGPLIDCDIHNELPNLDTLHPYLPAHWVDYVTHSAFAAPDVNDYPRGSPLSARADFIPVGEDEIGTRPGSSLRHIQEQVLDPWRVETGILNCTYWVQSVHDEYLAAALATALNTWQVEHWLEGDPRLRASIVVPSQNPMAAAAEIDRWGAHPGFVQVLLPVRAQALYGNRRYDPIFEAAARHELVIGIHAGGASGLPPSPVGWPATYIEEVAGIAQIFQSQVINLIAEGVFDRFPTLRVTLIESGFTWLPSLMWRIDKEWKGLRSDTPWVKRLPSAYMLDHLRITTQPLDAPTDPRQFAQIIQQLDSEELLLFATDYPHARFATPDAAFPVDLPHTLAHKIRYANAQAWYRL
ncbi:MAG: amidohydrolase family protein [Litorilinea sp.]